MACIFDPQLEKEINKVQDRWINSKTIDKWGFTDDLQSFTKLFETATGKELLAGSGINLKDIKKFGIHMETLIKDLKSPGVLSNKYLKNFYVGSAYAMRNPISNDFYKELVKANNYRNSHSQKMMSNYNSMLKAVKLAILESKNIDTSNLNIDNKFRFRDLSLDNIKNKKNIENVYNELNKRERSYLLLKEKGDEAGAVIEMNNLMEWLKGEGAIFEDFIERVVQKDDAFLKEKYMSKTDPNKVKLSKRNYISRINEAASSWRQVQDYAKDHLVKSINSMNEIVKIKYGETSKTSDFLIEKYKDIANKLEKQEGGYIPHYVLDLLKHSMEIPEKMATTESNTKKDEILKDYIDKAEEISTSLSQRLKEKGRVDMEYFSRNPMLYANKYIQQVTQFNHTTRVNLAYVKGLKKLSEVAFRNPDDNIGKTAQVYNDILSDLYSRSLGTRRVDESPTADNIVRLISSIQFISKLGFSTRGALRNATQRFLNFAWFGGAAQLDAINARRADTVYKNAIDAEMDKYGLRFVDVAQATSGMVSAADLELNGIEYDKGMFTKIEKEKFINILTRKGQSLAEASSIFTKWAENSNRRSTFNVAFHQRYQQLRKTEKYSNFESDTKEGQERLASLYKKSGDYASNMVSLLHFEYSPFGKAKILTGKGGTVLGTFQHYAFSFANLQTQMIKDYNKAIKAGDYFGPEAGRIFRLFSIYAITNLVSGLLQTDLTTYINNDTFGRANEFSKLMTGESILENLGVLEEPSKKEKKKARKEAFYGKGLVGASGIVPLNDIVEFHNLGSAAGYWKLLADPDKTAGWLTGMRDYKKIDNLEFAKEVGGMFSIEAERLLRRTIPAFTHENRSLMTIAQSELGLYPGTTNLGIKTRDMGKIFTVESEAKKRRKKSKRISSYNKMTKEQRAQKALAALAELY
tara:strand:- start:327 stop:3089 length:2763 start_codon:yes stop_codon:yes gene_type:complete